MSTLQPSSPSAQCRWDTLTVDSAVPHYGTIAPSAAVEVRTAASTAHVLCMPSKARCQTVQYDLGNGRRGVRVTRSFQHGQRQWTPTIASRSRHRQALEAHERSTAVRERDANSRDYRRPVMVSVNDALTVRRLCKPVCVGDRRYDVSYSFRPTSEAPLFHARDTHVEYNVDDRTGGTTTYTLYTERAREEKY